VGTTSGRGALPTRTGVATFLLPWALRVRLARHRRRDGGLRVTRGMAKSGCVASVLEGTYVPRLVMVVSDLCFEGDRSFR
jgi:hypothetical protein